MDAEIGQTPTGHIHGLGAAIQWVPVSVSVMPRHMLTVVSVLSYIGIAQGSLGPFFELSRYNDSEGWPSYSKPRRTFATTTGFWDSEPSTDELDPRGESFISGLPHFTDLLVEACGDILDGSTSLDEISDFASGLSL